MSPGPSVHSSSGRKRARSLSGAPGLRDRSLLATHAPSPATFALQQEDVVRVRMSADTPARRGVADHQVVQSRVGDEGEAAQQRVAGGEMQIDALHQQRPSARRERRKSAARKGPCASDQRPRSRSTSLDSTSSRQASRNSSARDKSPAKSRIAPRTSSARFCQCRRRNAAGVNPPSRLRSATSDIVGL